VNVDEPQAAAVQTMTLDEKERLVIRDRRNVRKIGKQRQNLPAIPQISTSQLTDNKRVHHNFGIFQQARQPCLAGAEVVDPHGCIDQNHQAARRRGEALAFRSVPAKAASRAALILAMRASRPR
jgi:hypothetical protein